MTELLIFSVVILLIVLIVPRIMKELKGCKGSCEQGREPCNCKGNQDGLS